MLEENDLDTSEDVGADVAVDEAESNQDNLNDVANELANEDNSRLQGSMFVAAPKNPDQHAKVLTLAQKFGARSDFVEANFDKLSFKNDTDIVNQKLDTATPKLKEFMMNPDNAAVAKDDLDVLKEIEKSTEEFGFWDSSRQLFKANSLSLASGTLKAPAAIGTFLASEMPNFLGTPEDMSKRLEFFRDNSVVNYLDKEAEELINSRPMLKQTIGEAWDKGDYTQMGKLIALQGIGATPATLGIIATSLAGGPLIGLAAAAASSAGSQFDESMDANKAAGPASESAMISGVAEGLFEKFGTGSIVKGWAERIAKSAGKQTALQVMTKVGQTVAAETFKEMSSEGLTSFGQDFGKYVTGLDPDAMKGSVGRALEASAVASISGFGMSSVSASIEMKHIQTKAQENIDLYKKLGESADASALKKRSPEKFGEIVAEMTKNRPVENIYMNAEGFNQYFQSKKINPAEYAKSIGIEDSYNKALESGSDIVIPTSVMAEKVAGSEHYQGLENHVKFNPEDLSAEELKVEKKRVAEDIKQEYEAAKDGKTEEQVKTVEDSAREVSKEITRQLKEVGYSPKAAKAQADLYEEFFKTQGMKSGQLPMDLLNKYGLRVNKIEEATGSTAGQKQYNQPQHLMSHGLMLGVTKVGNKLAVNPANGVEASGSITDSEAGKTFIVDKFKASGKYAGVSSDMITSLERSAAAQGAQTMMTSTSRLGITKDSPEFKMYTDAGFTPSTAVGQEDVVLVKKLEKPKTYNESRYYQSGQETKKGRRPKIKFSDELMENSKRLKSEGFDIWESEDTVFNDNGEEIEGKKKGKPGYEFVVNAQDSSGNDIGQARFKINEKGQLIPNDEQGGREAINVDPSYRNEGIGLELYRKASEYMNMPIENVNALTEKGQAFRDAIRKKAPTIFKQESDGDNKGSITFGDDRKFNINLFNAKDESTFLHETGHFFLEVLGDLSTTNDQSKQDYDAILKWFDVKDRSEIETKHHEQFARGFEKYLYSGEAPNSKLKKAFNAFRQWLIGVYKQAVNLDVEVTTEIKDVFDRMLAADEQIENVEFKQMFSDPFTFMPEKEALEYLSALEFAKADAKDKLLAKLMKDVVTKKESAYKKRYNEIKEQEKIKADKMVEFKTIDAIQGDLKLSKPLIDRDYEVFKNTLPTRSTQVDGGQNPDVVAGIFGYENGQAMLQAIAPFRRGKEDYIDMLTATRMKAENPELLESPELSQEAIKAAYNDNYKKLKRMELDYLFKNDPKVVKDVAAKLIKRMPSDKAVKQQAQDIIATTKVKDLKPYLYRNAEKKYSAEAAAAFKKGEYDLAFNAKKKEYLNFELFRYATEAQDDVKKSVKDFKKLFKNDADVAKNRDVDLVNAARAVLAEFGIVRSEKTAQEYLEKMKVYDPDAYGVTSILVAEATQFKGPYQDINYDYFVEMKNTVNNIYDLARDKKMIEIDGKQVNIDTVIGEFNAQVASITPEDTKRYKETMTKWGMVKEKLLGAKASLVRAEHWAKAMDVKDGGVFHKMMWQPVSDATTKYRLKKVEVLKKYETLLKEYGKSVSYENINATELVDNNGRSFVFKGKPELIMALLHTGNESNKRKLLLGREWGTLKPDDTVDTAQWDMFIKRMQSSGVLTKADYDFAQGIWDLLEDMKPDAQKAHKKMLGFYFNEITANAVQTPFGEYRGGYVPAKVDVYTNEDSAIRKEREEFESNNNSFQFPTTGRGFTKSRVDAYAAPLSLDINLLGSHIDGVLRFTHIEPVTKQMSHIVTNKEFRAQLALLDSNIAKDMLIPWLQRTAQQKVMLPSSDGLGRVTDAFARFFRRNVATQIMFGGVTNTLQQFTGLTVAMSLVKPKYIRNGLWSVVTNNKATINDIMEKSEWMKSTQGSNIQDIHSAINDIILNPSTFESIQNFSRKHTYFLQAAAQNFVNSAVWSGAYEEGITNGLTENEAVKAADSAVRRSQGTNNPEDVSRFEQGTATELLFKQFVGYFNMLANLNSSELIRISRDVGLRKGAGRGFYLYMTAFMIPAVISEAIVRTMSGQGFDEDDDDSYVDDFALMFFGSQFKTAAATLPYGGQLAVAGYNKVFTKGVADDRLSLSPVISTLESTVAVPYDVYKTISEDGDIKKSTVRGLLQMVGIFTGVPTGPAAKPIGYLMDVDSGKADPTGPIDYTRGLVTGRSGN